MGLPLPWSCCTLSPVVASLFAAPDQRANEASAQTCARIPAFKEREATGQNDNGGLDSGSYVWLMVKEHSRQRCIDANSARPLCRNATPQMAGHEHDVILIFLAERLNLSPNFHEPPKLNAPEKTGISLWTYGQKTRSSVMLRGGLRGEAELKQEYKYVVRPSLSTYSPGSPEQILGNEGFPAKNACRGQTNICKMLSEF